MGFVMLIVFCIQYLEKRFCRGVRIYGAIVYIIQMVSEILYFYDVSYCSFPKNDRVLNIESAVTLQLQDGA